MLQGAARGLAAVEPRKLEKKAERERALGGSRHVSPTFVNAPPCASLESPSPPSYLLRDDPPGLSKGAEAPAAGPAGLGRAPCPPGRRSCCRLCPRLPKDGGHMAAPRPPFPWPPPRHCCLHKAVCKEMGRGWCGEYCRRGRPSLPGRAGLLLSRRLCPPVPAPHLAASAPARMGSGPREAGG